mgnify:CR=1 FL=1|jgi:short-subunit dehydrogenase
MKILITGASSGLGAELARQYATSDVELVLLARREQNLLSLKNELNEKCKNIQIIAVDVTEFTLLQEKIKAMGYVDMVILNAGISLGHKGDIPTIEQFKNLYDVNVLSNHAILEILLPLFRAKHSGKIVFISSLASLFSMPTSKVYSSSKRALNAYAEGIRYKYKPFGVKVITILPGFIKSEMTDKNEFNMPFILKTKEGVNRIKNAIESGKEFYAFPFRFYLIIRVLNIFPSLLREKIVNYKN